MIHNFLRKLTPYSGYLGGSDSGGDGGGGGSSSNDTVSDQEFNDAIAAEEANRNQTNYGGNYYDNPSQSDAAQEATRQAEQRAIEAEAARQAEEARIAEQARQAEIARQAEEARLAEEARIAQEAAFQAEFDAAINQEKALEAAYGVDAFNITSNGIGDLSFEYIDPFSGESQFLTSTDDFESILSSSISAETNRLAEEARIAEEARLAEVARLAQEEAAREEARIAEEQARAEEARLQEEARIAEQARLEAEDSLAKQTLNPLDFLDSFNKSIQADINAITGVMPATQADPYASVKDAQGNFLEGVSIPGVTNTPQTVFTNELGQQYTQAEVDALGTKDAEGAYLIGNAANRVDMGDGQTGYLIGTGNNKLNGPDGGYSMGNVNYVAEGLLSPTPDYQTPTPEPTGVDRYIPRPDEALLDFYEENIGTKLTDDPNQYVDGWTVGMKTASQILDDAIASGEGITDYTFGDLQVDQRFFDIYAAQNYGVSYNDSVMSKYGTGPEGFNNFIGALEKAKEQGSTWLGGDPDVLIYEGKNLRDPNTGTVIAEDPVSFNGFMAAIAQGLGNFVLGQVGGGIAGDLVYSIFGGFKAPLFTAMGVRAGIQGYQPIQATGYVDEFGDAYTVSSFFGQETMAKVSEIKPQEYFESSSGQQVLSSAENIANSVNNGTAKGWRDYYNATGSSIGDVVVGAIIGNLVSGADSFTGDLIKAAEAVIVDGEDPVVAVVRMLGDNVADALPDGFDKLTPAAARIMVGENPIGVLGEIYGPEVGIEGPVGIAAIKGAVALDQGKSPEEALAISTYHYFKNGGQLPDFEAPSFLGDTSIDWPNVDLSFITDGVQSVVDFVKQLMPDMPDLGEYSIELPDIPVGEWLDSIGSTAYDVYKWVEDQMPSVPDIPQVDLPDIPTVDIPDLGLDWPDLGLALGGGSSGSTYVPTSRRKTTFSPSLIQNPLSNKLLSREVLGRTFKKV